MLKKSHTQQAEREDLFGHGVVWKKRVEKKNGDESLSGTVRRESYLTVGPFPKMFTCMLWIPKGFFFESDRTRILRSFLLDSICDGALSEQDLRGVELASSHRLSCYVSFFAHSQASTPPGQPVADAGEACGGRRNWQGSWQSARLASTDFIRRRNMGS
jgi:hypothetical protein